MDHHNHPCFSKDARHRIGRIHLPVAPKCNIQCNYCNRDFACVNESRPGVTGMILAPRQAADYLDEVLKRIPGIGVVGIAGPGDPFANPDETLETLRLVRMRHPSLMLCVATNGVALADHVDTLALFDVSHVTVTVNAIDPAIGGQIYAWARKGRKVYQRTQAARVIIESQIEAVIRLKEKGIAVKINSVVIPGINDDHIVEVAGAMAALKADIGNAIPMYHVSGTPFADLAPLPAEGINRIREAAGAYLPQMSHCARCRADAAGFIGDAQSEVFAELLQKAAQPSPDTGRPYVAVASMEGIFVNQHLGEASGLWIFSVENGRTALMDRRPTPPAGGGEARWESMAGILQDCHTLLVSGIGPYPTIVMERSGIRVIVMEGLAKDGIEAVTSGMPVPAILLKPVGQCGIGRQCRGSGFGCM